MSAPITAISSLAASTAETAGTSHQPPAPGVPANPYCRLGNLSAAKWSVEQDEHLRQCYANSMTGSETAASINSAFKTAFKTAYSRNAVIGRAMRLNVRSLNPPKPRINPNRVPPQRKPYVPKPKLSKPFFKCNDAGLRLADVDPLHVGLIDLQTGQCRWPYGDGPSFTFCGHPVLDGSYCFAHQQLSVGNGTTAERAASNVLRWGRNR